MNLISSERIKEHVELCVRITCIVCEQVPTVATLTRLTLLRRGIRRTATGRISRPYTTAHDVYVLDVVFKVRVWHQEESEIRVRTDEDHCDWTFGNFFRDYFLCRWLPYRSVSSVPLFSQQRHNQVNPQEHLKENKLSVLCFLKLCVYFVVVKALKLCVIFLFCFVVFW